MNTFIYINSFKYHDKDESKRFFGHPKPGKVYRAEKIESQGIYKVPLRSRDGVGGIVLDPNASEGRDDPGKWEFDISEVTEDNLSQFDISIDDLNIIQEEWIDDYEEREKEEIVEKTVEEHIGIVEGFEDATDALNVIVEHDEKLFFTLVDVMTQLALRFKKSQDDETENIINQIIELKNRRK